MKLEPQTGVTVKIIALDLYGGIPIINVQKGEIYSFKASKGKTWIDLFWRTSAKGFWNPFLFRFMKRVKKAKCFELCGTIGKTENDHFRIGLELPNFQINKSGDLYFFPNDSINFYANNKGYVDVEVKREL